jgi:hypothetical protein
MGELIMALDTYHIIIICLFLGGLAGWSLFAFSLIETHCNRREELRMIVEISEELKKVKEEIRELK